MRNDERADDGRAGPVVPDGEVEAGREEPPDDREEEAVRDRVPDEVERRHGRDPGAIRTSSSPTREDGPEEVEERRRRDQPEKRRLRGHLLRGKADGDVPRNTRDFKRSGGAPARLQARLEDPLKGVSVARRKRLNPASRASVRNCSSVAMVPRTVFPDATAFGVQQRAERPHRRGRPD